MVLCDFNILQNEKTTEFNVKEYSAYILQLHLNKNFTFKLHQKKPEIIMNETKT